VRHDNVEDAAGVSVLCIKILAASKVASARQRFGLPLLPLHQTLRSSLLRVSCM